jgi:hypothetical protein
MGYIPQRQGMSGALPITNMGRSWRVDILEGFRPLPHLHHIGGRTCPRKTKNMKLQLFTATAFLCGDDVPDVRGVSHWGAEEKIRVLWYPFEEYVRKVYFFAPHRRGAARQLESAGVRVRDLTDGQTSSLLCDSIKRQFASL